MTRLATAPPPPPAATPQSSPFDRFIDEQRERVRSFYDRLGRCQLTWNQRFRYFRERQAALLRHFIRPGARVLDIGCGTGDLLASVEPSEGVGVDCSPAMVDLARSRHPKLHFVEGFGESLDTTGVPDGPYDYVTLVNVAGEMTDVTRTLRSAHRYCSAGTRVILVQYNYLWEPICRVAARLKLKLNNPTPNWLALRDLEGICRLAGYEPVRRGHTLPLPIRIPGLNGLFNAVLGRFWGLRRLGFLSYLVARPIVPTESPERYTASVVVPCKDEQDNIEGLVTRIPEMGASTEIIFVDDKSTDETARRVQAAMAERPDRNIRLVTGPGQGKGAACRAGFEAATGDVLMILDADMTVMPEELPAFFDAITSGRGEFINGSRMVYPLADEAMRPLNILGNKMFAGLFSLVIEQRIRDTLCGTKVVWKRDYPLIMAARSYFGSCDRWGDYDWLFGAAKNNLKNLRKTNPPF